jgi:hypothetical protein
VLRHRARHLQRSPAGQRRGRGHLLDDAALACDSDADCTRTRARVARGEDACVRAGGEPNGSGSVCHACATTTTTTSTSTTSTSTTTLPASTVYGNAVEFPTASTHWPGYLLGSPLIIPRPSTLTHLGVIAKSSGPQGVLALYGDRSGAPDRLLAATPPTSLPLGAMEIPVSPVPLAPGTYWIMGGYDAEASIGLDESDPGAPVQYFEFSFSSPLPDPVPPASAYSGQRFNYYIRVLE